MRLSRQASKGCTTRAGVARVTLQRRASALIAAARAVAPACGAAARRQDPSVFTPAHRTIGEAARDFFAIRPAAVQPIPFPHKTHIAKKAVCADCHESAEKGPIAGIPSVKTCMICHSQIATDRPLIKQVTGYSEKGVEIPWQRVYGFTARGARALQPRAAHPRQRRLRDVPRRSREPDGRRARGRSQHGLLRELSQAEERAERLSDVSLLNGRVRRSGPAGPLRRHMGRLPDLRLTIGTWTAETSSS